MEPASLVALGTFLGLGGATVASVSFVFALLSARYLSDRSFALAMCLLAGNLLVALVGATLAVYGLVLVVV